MVQNTEWGPPLWRLLHTLAERLGRQTVNLLYADEIRYWSQLLQLNEAIMPCSLCRKHYREWKKARPIDALGGGDIRKQSRQWLYDLHEKVNGQRNVESGIELESLEELYGKRKPEEFQKDVEVLVEVLKRASLEGAVNAEYVRKWRGVLAPLRKLVGL